MRFFGRKEEIAELHEIQELSLSVSRFTIVTGRRRSGKTALLLKAYEGVSDMLYFFVARKTESELCRDFVEEISSKLQIPVLGEVVRFAQLFKFLLDLSKTRPLTLVIDEFQDFKRVNPSIFSDMQKLWDLNKSEARINLVVCGSVYSLMNKLFKNNQQPLYGRQTGELRVEPFPPSTIKEILAAHNPSYTADDLLALYAFTGGVAEYVEIMMDAMATDKMKMMERMVSKNSYFISEGKNMLIEEFGRDFGRYFEILSHVASGRTTRTEIEDVMKVEIAGYLSKLENDYAILKRQQPLFQKNNRNIRYQIDDCFLHFWFRFIYKYAYMIEVNAYQKLRSIVERDYTTFTGRVLEKWFRAVMMESESYTRIASWWDRKGENEIDIIAADELERHVCFFEVKRNADDINLGKLRDKAQRFFEVTGMFKRYSAVYRGLSLADI